MLMLGAFRASGTMMRVAAKRNWTRRSVISALAGGAALVLPAGKSTASRRFTVATTFTILRDIAANVAGEAAEIVSITRPGAEVHGYQPTPGDLVKIRDARLVLWNGMNMELWFERFFADLGGVPSAVLTEGITPIPIATGPYSGKPNPHAWMSPKNGMIYVENVRKALSVVDPANAPLYAANATRYTAEITALDAPLRARIGSIAADKRWLVTSEGAFSYLAADYGLQEAFIWPINADRQGSPQQLRRVIDLMRANSVEAVFSESTVSDKPARQIARETGARYGGVLYVDQLSQEDGPVPTYLKLLSVTVETIAKGLGA
jgi:manganese/iron transport system substrate-binding protein